MKILPVLDILGKKVVRGVAGQREFYRPIISRLTTSDEPLQVARSIRLAFGLQRLYLADLDAILSQSPNWEIYRDLIAADFELLVDAGVRHAADARKLHQLDPRIGIVVGLETCRSPTDLQEIVTLFGNVTFSLDLKSGVPSVPSAGTGWSSQAGEIIQQAANAHVQSILVLDLADVGMGTGGSTDLMCQFIRRQYPGLHLITGGGVRSREDLQRFSLLGVNSVLVASLLHDGNLGREEVHGW